MRHLKKFEVDEKFSEEEISEIQEIYLSIVDDIDLNVLKSGNPLKIKKEHSIINVHENVIYIWIKTSDISDIIFDVESAKKSGQYGKYQNLYYVATLPKKVTDYHNSIFNRLGKHIHRIKTMGYEVSIKDYSGDPQTTMIDSVWFKVPPYPDLILISVKKKLY